MHDGRTNRYTLELHGRRYTLHPLSPIQVADISQQVRDLEEKRKKERKGKAEEWDYRRRGENQVAKRQGVLTSGTYPRESFNSH